MKQSSSHHDKRSKLRRLMAEETARLVQQNEVQQNEIQQNHAPVKTASLETTVDGQPKATTSATKKHVIVFRKTPFWKRVGDIVLSLGLIIAISPLLICTALFIRLVSGKPVLYVQERLGAAGKTFRMYKFRTMKVSQDVDRDQQHRQYVASLAKSNAVLEKPDHSNQHIAGGPFLRSSSIDELPQLFNVLKGEMSLVGPRPDLLQLEDYEIEHLRRFEVLPGITGLWQVNDKNDLSFGEMIDLDIHYVDHRSPALDMKILIRTAATMVGNSNS